MGRECVISVHYDRGPIDSIDWVEIFYFHLSIWQRSVALPYGYTYKQGNIPNVRAQKTGCSR